MRDKGVADGSRMERRELAETGKPRRVHARVRDGKVQRALEGISLSRENLDVTNKRGEC